VTTTPGVRLQTSTSTTRSVTVASSTRPC
jgi:hypothetical protein